MEKPSIREILWVLFVSLLKVLLTGVILYLSFQLAFYIAMWGTLLRFSILVLIPTMLLLPSLTIPLLFIQNKKQILIIWGVYAGLTAAAIGINYGMIRYEDSITIDTAPNINVEEYLPFREDTKIAKLEKEASLRFAEDDILPIVDGAAAVFPVYSAFVNATYPNLELNFSNGNGFVASYNDRAFQYNNTVSGYQYLAQKDTDIFFGAYPSEDQISYARSRGTTFVYTPIGYEAFVFFVNKDNPIDSLTTEQIQEIYSGEITNWNQVGGRNESIAAYQRNSNSGSQSMLIRFMDGKPLMEPPSDYLIALMSGMAEIASTSSDYRNSTAAIGFSFRYYLEGIIQNPDLKILSIDGIAPTVENIQNGTYPIITPLYAVTWAGNENENVQRLLDWILSEEGQYLIEQTGYVPLID